MSLSVTLDLPPELVEQLRRENPNLNSDVTEVYTLELFRRGKLSHYELSRVLGLDHIETDACLRRHGIYDGSLTMSDLESDRQTLERVLHRGE